MRVRVHGAGVAGLALEAGAGQAAGGPLRFEAAAGLLAHHLGAAMGADEGVDAEDVRLA